MGICVYTVPLLCRFAGTKLRHVVCCGEPLEASLVDWCDPLCDPLSVTLSVRLSLCGFPCVTLSE